MRKILVAIDGSENALRALDFAMQQAALKPEASLHVLTVEPPAGAFSAWEIYVTAESLQKIAAERAKGILDAAAARLSPKGCRFELEQLEGDPAETIARRRPSPGAQLKSAANRSRWALMDSAHSAS